MDNMQEMITPEAPAIGKEDVARAVQLLKEYKAGKATLEQRVISSQNWWKLRNWTEIEGVKGANPNKPSSAWLWNSIVGKHADAMAAYPEPVILPRMMDDEEEAARLSAVVPVILGQNDFEEVYSDCTWQKMLEGTAIYGCYWDKTKHNGLGDVSIRRVDVLNLYWQPGINDIQQSRNVFHVELMDNDLLISQYPQLRGKLNGTGLSVAKYIYDDHVDTSKKTLVVDWYYHRYNGPVKVLHYVKFCGETVLYATENEPEMRDRGLYDGGEYPFVFDRLYPVQGSPCGYGYIDIGKGTQETIDVLNQAMTLSSAMSATPRYFISNSAGINEKEFADFSKPFVHVNGSVTDANLMQINVNAFDGSVLAFLNQKLDELKSVTGNQDVNNGGTVSGVTAASAIAALQEASGRSSRASTRGAYRAYTRLVHMVIERIRQFYDLPRQFRILGNQGRSEYVTYTNAGLKAQSQGMDFGVDMGLRLPVFDIDVRAQKENPYTKISQNELALQLYNAGMLSPQMVDQSLIAIKMMDFKGKDELMQKLSEMTTMTEQLAMYQQIALQLAQQVDPALAEQLAGQIAGEVSAGAGMHGQADPAALSAENKESSVTANARKHAEESIQPN